jgi:hypothetical protein
MVAEKIRGVTAVRPRGRVLKLALKLDVVQVVAIVS